MGNVSTKPNNTSDAPKERSEQGQELQEFQARLSFNAESNSVHTVTLKNALKKKKEWLMVRDDPVKKKEVRLNLEMRDENLMSPPASGYGVKFLETQVWPGRDFDQAAEVDDEEAPGFPEGADSPDAANSPEATVTDSESKD